MESIWSRTCGIRRRKKLEGKQKTEIVVIGAGITGVLIAYKLQKAGKKVIVLEADRIAFGQTKNTTAKITSQHGFLYHHFIKTLGRKKAFFYAQANERAVREYVSFIQNEKINCDFEETCAWIYSEDEEQLKEEAKAAASLGLPAVFEKNIDIPIQNAGGVCFAHQAQFHPLKFIKELAEKLTIYEDSPVEKVERECVYTPEGAVYAEHIVFACHYPFLKFPGLYFARMHQERSYVLALENAKQPNGMFIGVNEEETENYTFRNYKNFLLFGGKGHRTGENIEGMCYESLRKKAKELFPESKEVTCWSAQDCVTFDSIPFIGKYSQKHPNWYIATGFKKWGMTSSMVSAMILSDVLLGKENQYQEIFQPNRFSMEGVLGISCEVGHAVKSLTRRIFMNPEETQQELSCGHGGIVLINGEKMGVYKDENYHLHIVDIRCPHMGCQLEWNQDEKSWDCPCHGSRFTYDGKLISNPAQKSLKSWIKK